MAYSSGLFSNAEIYSTASGAIDGYDPVAYFTEGIATPGSELIVTEHLGVSWHFATQENRQLFLDNPERYMPQYGGFCAYAMSENYTAYTDPQAWSLVDDRLYLNYSADVKVQWENDKLARIATGNENWQQRVLRLAGND